MWEWLQGHDRGYAALRRATRAAILMPAMFALGDKVIGNPGSSYFLAFGSFAMLLLVDFGGPLIDRVRAQALLAVACAVLITLGTLVSGSTAAAVVAMGVVAFVVLFAGVVSSVLAGATTALLLSFILPVTIAGGASQIPDRVAGWGLASVVSLFAITLLWPAPAATRSARARSRRAARSAARLRGEIAWVRSDGGGDAKAAYEAAVAAATDAVEALQSSVLRHPLPPDRTGDRGTRGDPPGRRAALARTRRPALGAADPPRQPHQAVCAVKLARRRHARARRRPARVPRRAPSRICGTRGRRCGRRCSSSSVRRPRWTAVQDQSGDASGEKRGGGGGWCRRSIRAFAPRS